MFVSKADHCFHDLALRWRAGEFAGELVAIVSNHADLAEAAGGYGLAFHHIPVTAANKVAAEGQQLELLRTLGVTKQSLNGPLRDLYAQQLIAWEPDAADARGREDRGEERRRALPGRRLDRGLPAQPSQQDEEPAQDRRHDGRAPGRGSDEGDEAAHRDDRRAEAHRDPGEPTRLALPDRDAGRAAPRSGTQFEQGS